MGAALSELLARFGSQVGSAESLSSLSRADERLPLGWPELDAALPDGGMPRGVVELTAPHALGGCTSIVLAAMRAAHARDARAWCAWVDSGATLYAPGIVAAGVDLARLLVVRPSRADVARVAVKVAASRAFDVIAVDVDTVPGAVRGGHASALAVSWVTIVRKLALLAAEGGSTILLLTDSAAPRLTPWPVALRLELERAPRALRLRVAKDRRGRVGLAKTVPLRSRPWCVAVGVPPAREAG